MIGQDDQARWEVVESRGAGAFVYAVTTTGIFCRPGCASRRPRRENVRFFDGPTQARAAGFRACRRCRPDVANDDPDREVVAAACRLIDRANGSPPTLDDLAAAVGSSPTRLRRAFARSLGLTPRGYAEGRRAERLRAALRGASTAIDAGAEAGFGSGGRLYEAAGAALGMTPAAYRRGAPGERLRAAVSPCSLGQVLVVASTGGIAAIVMGDDRDELLDQARALFPAAELAEADPALAALVARVVALVDDPARGEDLPLDLRGTAFQIRVWQALRAIPLGSTTTYTEVAGRIGRPEAVRAVAGACAANLVAVAVPCHRVIRTDGALGGYRWGLDRKRALLAIEARAAGGGAGRGAGDQNSTP